MMPLIMSWKNPHKIVIASDHAGFELKQGIVQFLKDQKIPFEDLGPQNTESVDYPDYAALVASLVSKNKADRGILICGTGMGMCMTANKFSGVRAATVADLFTAEMVRKHNDANVLCLGARVTKPDLARDIVKTFLTTEFERERHERRVKKIEEIEKKNMK